MQVRWCYTQRVAPCAEYISSATCCFGCSGYRGASQPGQRDSPARLLFNPAPYEGVRFCPGGPRYRNQRAAHFGSAAGFVALQLETRENPGKLNAEPALEQLPRRKVSPGEPRRFFILRSCCYVIGIERATDNGRVSRGSCCTAV